MPSPSYPVLCCPLPDRVAPVFVQVVSPPLGWSPLSPFLVIWSPSGDTRGPWKSMGNFLSWKIGGGGNKVMEIENILNKSRNSHGILY